MWDVIYWVVVLALLGAIGFAGIIGTRAYLTGASPGELLFKARAEPRLGIVEYANVDGKRKLILIRRDDVEHLIMTGGPVDVVVETGIGEKKRPARLAEPPPLANATVLTRPARTLAQVSPGTAGSGEAS